MGHKKKMFLTLIAIAAIAATCAGWLMFNIVTSPEFHLKSQWGLSVNDEFAIETIGETDADFPGDFSAIYKANAQDSPGERAPWGGTFSTEQTSKQMAEIEFISEDVLGGNAAASVIGNVGGCQPVRHRGADTLHVCQAKSGGFLVFESVN